jgi:thiol-disulfide isomerase/thioredoxin
MFLSLLLSCVPASTHKMLIEQNQMLQADAAASRAELATCQDNLARVQGAHRSQAQADAKAEEEANALYAKANELMGQGDVAGAQAALDELQKNYGDTRVASRANRLAKEMAVIGMTAPPVEVEYWFQGNVDVNSGTTLVVFWESWCPHCRRELPNLDETYERLGPEGLQVVGFTKLTKSSTDEAVREFIAEHDVGFPIAKETGTLTTAYSVSGIPAAAVVKDGVVVWRGHPARLSDETLRGWL